MHRIAALAFGMLLAFTASGARADLITDWNLTTHRVLDAAQSSGGPAARTLTIVHVAMSDAINSVQNRYTRYVATIAIVPDASVEAAAASAARNVLLQLYPKQTEMIEQAYAASTKAIADGPAKTKGVTLGEQVAAAVVAERATDGATVPDSYRPITSPGIWVPTVPPITEQFARAKPWVIKSASHFRPAPPPQLNSAIYARDYNETKDFGSVQSKARSAEQTAAVAFWRTPNIGPAWMAAAREFTVQKGLTLADSARLFALLSMATVNSYITDWDAKFTYNFWRPVTAIRNGDLDGNDATERDAGWSPMAPTPLHPEYPSQASILAGVSVGILEAVLGPKLTGSFIATDIADEKKARTLTSLAAMAEEHRNVRVWGGIHFRNSLNVAQDMGGKIAAYLVANSITPVR